MTKVPFFSRYEFTLGFVTETPLHLGSGQTLALDEGWSAPGRKTGIKPDVATVVRDYEGKPYIPSTSIKGALRSVLQQSGADQKQVKSLFGEIRNDVKQQADDISTGTAGALRIFGAKAVSAGPAGSFPFPQKTDICPEIYTYVEARTAINDATGTAEENKLFYSEMILPQTRFCFEMHFMGEEKDLPVIFRMLKTMETEGLQLGRGAGYGHGRIRLLADELQVAHTGLDLTKNTAWQNSNCVHKAVSVLPDWDTGKAKSYLHQAEGLTMDQIEYHHFKLKSDAPFFVNDSFYQMETEQSKKQPNASEATKARPALRALRENGKAYLPATSLMGALRARMEWLEELDALNDEVKRKVYEDDDKNAIPRRPSSRLFGRSTDKPGIDPFAGLLKVKSITHADKSADPKVMTSVKIDRFSGASIDGALFSVDSFAGPEFEVTLALEKRPGVDVSDDSKCLEALIKDLVSNGLMLGHATSRGFGWFEVEKTDK